MSSTLRGRCELCGMAARMFCESDQAMLCWVCDEKVHSANFLVAKHTRVLLCRVCLGHTPWKASGSRLGPTLSMCHSCSCDSSSSSGDKDRPAEEEEEEVEEAAGSRVGEEEESGENQVVPWSPVRVAVASSSSSEGEEGGVWACGGGGLKRVRGRSDASDPDDPDRGGGPGRITHEEGNALASPFTRPSRKQPRTSEEEEAEQQQEFVHRHDADGQGVSSRSTAKISDCVKRNWSLVVGKPRLLPF